jgi:molybdate transport system regulatory protein
MEKQIEIRVRHWVYVNNTKFFGPGRLELLQHIQSTGSIAQAAKAMGLSYKKAWTMVDSLNSLGTSPYVVTQKGGAEGGGTILTETGIHVMEAYQRLNQKLLAVAEAEQALLTLI